MAHGVPQNAQYVAEVQRAMTDHSWETPAPVSAGEVGAGVLEVRR
jgi:hypothetical protein